MSVLRSDPQRGQVMPFGQRRTTMKFDYPEKAGGEFATVR
jgi:hypothetical protein